MHKRAILFDIDGTLVDSNEAHVDAWYRAFAAEGLDIGRPAIREQIGKGGDNLLPALLPQSSAALRKSLADTCGDTYKREYLHEVRPFPGARAILERAARSGQKIVLASSASRQELDHYVELLAARELLSGTTSKDDVRRSKPCPDIFMAALESVNCAPAEGIVIGDTPYDIEAARAAGMDTVAVLSGGFAEEVLRACNPVAIYDDVSALHADYDASPLGS